MRQISELKSSFLARLYELYFEVLLFRDSTENDVHFRSSQSICTASRKKFTVCRPDHSHSVRMVNAESVISALCAAGSLRGGRVVWPLLKPASYLPLSPLLFLPPPIHPPIPVLQPSLQGVFSAATALLLSSSTHPVSSPPSVSSRCHSQPTVIPGCLHPTASHTHPLQWLLPLWARLSLCLGLLCENGVIVGLLQCVCVRMFAIVGGWAPVCPAVQPP